MSVPTMIPRKLMVLVVACLFAFGQSANGYTTPSKSMALSSDEVALVYKNKYQQAVTNYRLGYYDKALVSLQQCMLYYAEADADAYLLTLHYAALVYFKKGNYLQSSLLGAMGTQESKRLKNKRYQWYFDKVSGLNSYATGKYNAAITMLTPRPNVIQKRDDATEALSNLYTAKSYWRLGQQANAIPYLKAIDVRFGQQGVMHPDLRSAYELLIDYYADTPKAQLVYIRKLQKADQLMEQQYPFLFAKTNKKYDAKRLEFLKQQAEGSTWWIWLTLVLVFLLASFFFYKNRHPKSAVIPDTILTLDSNEEEPESIEIRVAKQTDDKYLDSADVKQLFQIVDMTLYRWRKEGHIPYTKMGGKIVYPKQAVLAILQQRLDDKYDPLNIKTHQKGE